MGRRRFPASIVFAVVFCFLLPNDWTFLSPSKDSSSGSYRTFVFADATSAIEQRSTEDEKNPSSVVRLEENAVAEGLTFSQIVAKAGRKGLGGGLPGAIAGVVQVLTLMGLRTVINYQMRYGTTFSKALDVLYRVSLPVPTTHYDTVSTFWISQICILNLRRVAFAGFTEGLDLPSSKLRYLDLLAPLRTMV
jgi:hypothetical protein